MRTRTTALAIAAVLVHSLGPVTPALAADPVTVTFNHTGAEQQWLVPNGVSSINVVLVGGRGGAGENGGSGGFGHRVSGDLAVTSGSTIYIEVGGNGSVGGGSLENRSLGGAGGFNGGGRGGDARGPNLNGWPGGGGGGASDLRTLPRSDSGSLGSRLLVAGAGAGSGGEAGSGAGGNAGSAGQSTAAGGGGAGTSAAGGTGGLGANAGLAGMDGSLGTGGAGGYMEFAAGGGAGGGLFGGGGGGGNGNGPGAGGGGGSSSTGAAANASITVDATGTPSISIIYLPEGGSTGTIDAVVTMASSAVCLELSTTSIDFGTRRFGEVGAAASPSFEVTNCSGIAEAVLARGTDAEGPGSSAWSLVDTGSCAEGTLGTNAYRLTLEFPAAPGAAIPLSTENSESVVSLGAGDTLEEEVLLDTPCAGSSGAGDVMSMQILFTAIEEALP